ncbi:predicted protein [Naegleria gruberi]|uniref:Predicted protein n=1 Tax=Naegleria gruberi TaxID=5762 RepID=D2VFC1_NAEGR|nr:uncharacterized protein NAEGRDRAFT_67574 [Naegleria gruberi]EFC44433.1 predicted protein [Naegleria gruberi]|eukprot:XP_002677177.1 predicted protein [Naegleria gruberi strain NEG-M]
MSIPFGTAYVEDRNSNLFSPVKPMGDHFDLCAKYSNVSCVETFCNGENSTVKYELLNYCQYCSEGKDFLEFHTLIIDMDNYSDTKKSKCPSFTRFPSSFFCEAVQTGFPVYFMDQYFERLRTPFLCYCHRFDIYSNLCDPVMNSLLRTDAVNMIKFILSLLISIPLCPFAILGYVVPEFVTMIIRRKLRVLNALCAIIILLQSICVVVACMMFWNPTYDSFDTLYFTTSIALSLNVFFTHYGSLAVLLVFDRICQFLKAGDNKNSLVALILIGFSFVCNSLCAIYIVSYLIYELETQQVNIILTGMSYVSYSLPWIVNFLVFIYIAKKLGDQLQEKTHISFYKSKVRARISLNFPI